MNAKWVVNASPLILLAKVHRLGLLVELAQTVVIPESVAAEIKAGPDNDRWCPATTGQYSTLIRSRLFRRICGIAERQGGAFVPPAAGQWRSEVHAPLRRFGSGG